MPVTTPRLVCVGCGRQVGVWSPLCSNCQLAVVITDQHLVDDELPPCVGAKFADTTDHIFRTAEEAPQ